MLFNCVQEDDPQQSHYYRTHMNLEGLSILFPLASFQYIKVKIKCVQIFNLWQVGSPRKDECPQQIFKAD